MLCRPPNSYRSQLKLLTSPQTTSLSIAAGLDYTQVLFPFLIEPESQLGKDNSLRMSS